MQPLYFRLAKSVTSQAQRTLSMAFIMIWRLVIWCIVHQVNYQRIDCPPCCAKSLIEKLDEKIDELKENDRNLECWVCSRPLLYGSAG